jgi:hypothetical protein
LNSLAGELFFSGYHLQDNDCLIYNIVKEKMRSRYVEERKLHNEVFGVSGYSEITTAA